MPLTKQRRTDQHLPKGPTQYALSTQHWQNMALNPKKPVDQPCESYHASNDSYSYCTSAHPTESPDVIKNTPHLTAILTRAASKTKSTFSFRFPAHPHNSPAPTLPATAEYRPSSLPSFLSRLATYKLTTYANKPSSIDAVAASKCGWINDGKDRLICGLCNASWVVVGREGLNRDAGKEGRLQNAA
jgi:hypothetical protein